MKDFDWIIVGAGPAGATAARFLAKMGKVLLLDRRRLDCDYVPNMSGKCCGGLLAPDAQRVLAEFGLSLPQKVIGGNQIFAVNALDLDSGIKRIYQRFYLNLQREAFDRWLTENALAAGSQGVFGAEFIDFNLDTVTYRINGKLQKASCRYLVAADGAASAVEKRVCRIEKTKCYVAIQNSYELKGNDSPYFSAFFDTETTNFYGWAIPKCEVLLVGCAFPPGGDPSAKMKRFVGKLKAADLIVGEAIEHKGALLRRPRFFGDFWLGQGNNVFAIGEAAGLISPSSAEGISYALRSAGALAKAFARQGDKTCVNDYRREATDILRDLRIKTLKLPVLYQPALRKIVMKSGVGALPPPPRLKKLN